MNTHNDELSQIDCCAMKAATLSSYLPAPLRDALRPAVLMIRNGSVPVSRLEGVTRVGPAAVLVAGSSHTAVLLARRLFSGEVRTVDLATVPVWRLDSFVRKMARDVDLSITCVDKLSARLLFQSDCLRVPESIDVGLKVPENINSLWQSNHSLQQDIRQVHRKSMEMSVSQAEADFAIFYHTMYLPFLAGRHGDMARPRDESWLRNCFLRGKIIWVVRGGDKLAGVVVEIANRVLHFWAVATRDGDPGLMKEGAIAALYLYAIQHAHDEGCSFIDFGSCKAFLGDGILRYKRKWGMEMRPRLDNQNVLLIRWPVWNDAVRSFLAETSIVHENGLVLKVVTACGQSRPADQADVDQIHRSVFMPGIDRFVIVNSAGWERNVVPPGSTVLTDGSPSAAQLANI